MEHSFYSQYHYISLSHSPINMAFLFGGARPSGVESVKDFQRNVASNARGMDRELSRIELQEKQMIKDLTKYGREGKLDSATGKAKELIRLRCHKGRVQSMKVHMTGLSQQLHMIHNSNKIQETLSTTSKMLQGLNSRMDISSVHRMLLDFEKQNVLITNKQEIVDETLDSAFEVDGEQEATDEAVLGVLEEAGLDMSLLSTKKLENLPSGGVVELEQRFEALKSGRV